MKEIYLRNELELDEHAKLQNKPVLQSICTNYDKIFVFTIRAGCQDSIVQGCFFYWFRLLLGGTSVLQVKTSHLALK